VCPATPIASPSPTIDSFLWSTSRSPFAGATALITIKRNCCPYPSMSSCAVSCCICFPKASSAFATLASSPTGGAPLSSRSAFNYSEQYSHRRSNLKPPLPRNRAHFGSVPSVAERWWSSRDLPLPRSNSALRLRSSVPHETNYQNPQISIRPSARSALVRLAAEKSSSPCPKICSNRHHLPLPSSSQSHTALLPPSTPLHRPPHATHRRY
jgi:hypothetical protein